MRARTAEMTIHIQIQISLNATTNGTLMIVYFTISESLAAFAEPIGRLACPGREGYWDMSFIGDDPLFVFKGRLNKLPQFLNVPETRRLIEESNQGLKHLKESGG
jgi:hypothetical protein